MATYIVTVAEISKSRVEVEANSRDEAVKKFEEQYYGKSSECPAFIVSCDILRD